MLLTSHVHVVLVSPCEYSGQRARGIRLFLTDDYAFLFMMYGLSGSSGM